MKKGRFWVISMPHAENLNIPIGILRFFSLPELLGSLDFMISHKIHGFCVFPLKSHEFSCFPRIPPILQGFTASAPARANISNSLGISMVLRAPFLPRTPENWKFHDFPGISPNLAKFLGISVNLVKFEEINGKW